jgi:class 3 adenylate cyclase
MAENGFEELQREADCTAHCALSIASLAVGDPQSAERLYRLLEPYGDRFTVVIDGSLCLGSNHAFLGFAAKSAGRWDIAIRHFERAVELNDAAGVHYLHPRIHHEWAQSLLRRGRWDDADRAAELVEAGLGWARKLGMSREVQGLMTLRLEQRGLTGMGAHSSIEVVAQAVDQARPDLRPAAAPDGTVTIMFSDIEGSTVLTDQLGDRRWLAVLHHHNEIIRSTVREHHGYEVKSQGDGFMIAFSSARSAIYCAMAIQRRMAEHRRRNPSEPLRVRIGLHTGEVIREGEDFFGKNVILAARIGALANGDEILVSSLLREVVAAGGEFEFDGGREVELKGIRGSQRVYRVPWEAVRVS